MKRVFIFVYGADFNTFMKLNPKPEEPIICADSGIFLAKKLRYKPRNLFLIGDLDSVPKQVIKWCKNNKIKVIKHPTNKDFTDGHLALEYACKNYPNSEKIIIGGITNQLDHTLGNIFPAVSFVEKGHKIKILDDRQVVYISNKTIELTNCNKHSISLIPLKETFVTKTEGLKWKLNNELINIFQSRTLRNLAIKPKVKISIKSGILMVIDSW